MALPKRLSIMFIMLVDLNRPCTLLGKYPMMKQKSEIRKQIPTFERYITKREFTNAFGFAALSHTLRNIFKQLTGDKSAATNVTEAEIDR